MLALCDLLELERVVAVGMSQGGRVALQFALGHPERVAGMVLQGTPLGGFQPGPREEDSVPVSAFRGLVGAGRLAEMKRLWAGHPLMRGVPADDLLAGYDGRDLLVDEGPPPPLAAALGRIAAPSLVVTGQEETAWLQLVGDALAYGIPDARRARLPGGHLCNLSHPGPYNEMVASFAAEVAA